LEEKGQVLALCEALYNKKALDIVAVHVEERTIIASWFILCSGRSVTQVKALCDELEKEAKVLGLDLRRREGYSQGQWVVLDYSSILVHLFIPDVRKYYNLERLWIESPEQTIMFSLLKEEGSPEAAVQE